MTLDSFLHNWKVAICDGLPKVPKAFVWVSPKVGELKFNVYGVARKKPRPTGVGSVGCGYFGSASDFLVFFMRNWRWKVIL